MTPPYLGHAMVPANTDLDLLAQTAGNANANATTALANSAAALAALSIFPSPKYGRTTTTLQQYITDTQTLWAGDYGVVGDGVADDTAAMNYALAQAALANRVLYMGKMIVKITGALTMTGPGLVWDTAGFGNAGDPGILVTGAGYTALTVSGSPQAFIVSVYGTGNACAGVLFSNPQRAVCLDLRVYNLAGVGCNITQCFDCLFGTISVELCGSNAANGHAFLITDGGGTSNETTILRLQVEQANCQAISISPNSLNLAICLIHSERLNNPDNTKPAWILGGAGCWFGSSRFTSNGVAANAIVWLRGAYSEYSAMRVESGCTVNLEGTSGTGIVVVSPNFTGNTSEFAGQSGALVIIGGNYGTWVGSTANRYFFGPGSAAFLPLSGGTMTGDITMGTGGTQLKRSVTYPGFGILAKPTAQIAVNGTVDIGGADMNVLSYIVTDGNEMAEAALLGGGANTVVRQISGAWSGAQGTAGKHNVYWNAGTSTYRIENKTATPRFYYIVRLGDPITM